MRSVERSTERRALVREAGLSSVSTVSVLAGVLVAYGAVLLLLALAAGVGSALGFETTGITDAEWRDIGVGAAIALGVVLFASYLFGGYVAGRMGRRAGATHGLLVFVLGVVVIAIVAAVTANAADGDVIADELRNQGIPTAADDWRDIGLFGGLGLLVAMLVGSVLGGIKGERWHGILVTRALDPEVLPRGVDADHGPQDRPRHDDTQAVPVVDGGTAVRTTDDTTQSPTVRRDERLPAGDDIDVRTHRETEATPTVVRDERETAARAGDSVDLTEAERTAAARQDVEAARLAEADRTRATRLG